MLSQACFFSLQLPNSFLGSELAHKPPFGDEYAPMKFGANLWSFSLLLTLGVNLILKKTVDTTRVKVYNFELAIFADSLFSFYLCHRDWLLLQNARPESSGQM